MICGPQAVGKITMGEKFHDLYKNYYGGAPIYLRTDVVRDVMVGGNYSREMRDLVYETMHFVAKKCLRYGRDVVVDATYMKKRWRDYAFRAAKGLTQ